MGNPARKGKKLLVEKMEKKAVDRKKGNRWNGGLKVDGFGYVSIFSENHPFRRKDKYFLEHRLVMEKHLGRFLSPEEVVHHKGIKYPLDSKENKGDNRIDNLELLPNLAAHVLIHMPQSKSINTDKQRQCSKCKKVLKLNSKNFFKNSTKKLGFRYICKHCHLFLYDKPRVNT